MSYNDKKWINFIVAALWLIVTVTRILEKSSFAVIGVTFAAAVIFFALGIYYGRQAKK